MLCGLFDWTLRWSGPATGTGRSVHVGEPDGTYVALFTGGVVGANSFHSYLTSEAMNHIGVVVDDIDAAEARVRKAGFAPENHADYEPGKRFYFTEGNGVEIEVVSYS